MIIPQNDGFTLEFVSGTIRAARRRKGGESYTRVKRAIATYRIVPGYRVSLAGRWSRGRDSRYKTAGRDVMNAWNLSMDGAPMINRASRRRGSLYSREAAGEWEEERGEGGETPRGWKGMSSFDEEFLPCDAARARWQIGSRFYARYIRHSRRRYRICMYVCMYIRFIRPCLRRNTRVPRDRREIGTGAVFDPSVNAKRAFLLVR